VLNAGREISDYFDALAGHLAPQHAKLAANWVMGEVAARLNRDGLDFEQVPLPGPALAGLLARIADGTLSGKMAKEVFEAMWAGEGSAEQIIEARGLRQISDSGALEQLVAEVVQANPAQVAEYRSGKEKAFNFLVGQCMKASKGKANPAQLSEILKKTLGKL
jgi:aspartyl-tRNA(Asn)/glutamyl-tRNA(Gln) amidotransferase subunit B